MNSIFDTLDLSDELRARARPLDEIGVNETAWPKTAALELLERLHGQPIAVLGSDVLRPGATTLAYNWDNWHSDQRPHESFGDYAARSQRDAVKYISDYSAQDSHFVLVLQRG